MQTKYIIYLIFPFFAFLTSCDKDEMNDVGTPANTFSAKIDGVSFNGNAYSVIANETTSLVPAFFIQGNNITLDGGFDYDLLQISYILEAGIPIESQTYTQQGQDCTLDQDNDICMIISYIDFNSSEDGDTYVSNMASGNATVDIESIDYREGGHIRGTFSGMLYNESGESTFISEGKIDLPIL